MLTIIILYYTHTVSRRSLDFYSPQIKTFHTGGSRMGLLVSVPELFQYVSVEQKEKNKDTMFTDGTLKVLF